MKILQVFRLLATKALAMMASCLMVLMIGGAPNCLAQSASGTDGWVVLPVDDYRALWRAAYPAAVEPEPPPVEATLTRVDYELRVDGDFASGEARLTVDVIKEGWIRVPIPGGLLIRQSRLDGRPVSLVTQPSEKGTAASYVLLSRTGRSVLTLTIVAPISAVAGTEMLKLPVSASAISRASVVLPRAGVDVRVTGGLLLENSDTGAGVRWVAHGRGGDVLTFAWRRKLDDQRATQALRMRGTLTQLVGLGEDTTQINAEVQIEVLAGLAREVRLQLPDQFTVNQVSGAMVADWESTAKELVVTFLEPVSQTSRFTLSGEVRLPRDGQIDIPLIRLPSAERETGGLAVEVLGAAEIKDRKQTGLEEAEAAYLGPLISSRQSPSLMAFRLRPAEGQSARSLSLRVARYTPQAVLAANVEEAAYSALMTDDGKMLVQARFAVRNNQRNFLKINLPSGASLWSVSVAGRPIRPGLAPDGSLLVPLEKSRTGEEAPVFTVEVSYLNRAAAWTDKGRAKLSLLTVDMAISKSRLLVHHSPLFRLTAVPGTFRTAEYDTQGSELLRRVSNYSATVESGAVVGAETKELVDRIQKGGRAAGPARNLPISVAFLHFGPSVFVVSELTSENQTPVLEFDYQRERKRGAR